MATKKRTASMKPVDTKKDDDVKASIEEVKERIVKMKEDRDAKTAAAKKQLVDMLDVTKDKYLTATGTAEALRVLRFAIGEHGWDEEDIASANSLAHELAFVTDKMRQKAEGLAPEEMDKLCEGFYAQDFKVDQKTKDENAASGLAFEMMRIDLCRNVGGAAEDMMEFVTRVEGEIKEAEAGLAELEAQLKAEAE